MEEELKLVAVKAFNPSASSDLATDIEHLKEAGYGGVVIDANSNPKREVSEQLLEADIQVLIRIYQPSNYIGSDGQHKEHATSDVVDFERALHSALEVGPRAIIASVGSQSWPLSTKVSFFQDIDKVITRCKQALNEVSTENEFPPIFFSTTSNTALYHPWEVAGILASVPSIELHLDLGQWCAAAAVPLGTFSSLTIPTSLQWQKLLRQVRVQGKRTLVDACIGDSNFNRVTHPGDRNYKSALTQQEKWWTELWLSMKQNGHQSAFVLVDPLSWKSSSAPFVKVPTTFENEIASWVMERLPNIMRKTDKVLRSKRLRQNHSKVIYATNDTTALPTIRQYEFDADDCPAIRRAKLQGHMDSLKAAELSVAKASETVQNDWKIIQMDFSMLTHDELLRLRDVRGTRNSRPGNCDTSWDDNQSFLAKSNMLDEGLVEPGEIALTVVDKEEMDGTCRVVYSCFEDDTIKIIGERLGIDQEALLLSNKRRIPGLSRIAKLYKGTFICIVCNDIEMKLRSVKMTAKDMKCKASKKEVVRHLQDIWLESKAFACKQLDLKPEAKLVEVPRYTQLTLEKYSELLENEHVLVKSIIERTKAVGKQKRQKPPGEANAVNVNIKRVRKRQEKQATFKLNQSNTEAQRAEEDVSRLDKKQDDNHLDADAKDTDSSGDEEVMMYTTQDNDTMLLIAEAFKLDITKLFEMNKRRFPGVKKHSRFRAGTAIFLPESTEITSDS